jgi:hypothetical protein
MICVRTDSKSVFERIQFQVDKDTVCRILEKDASGKTSVAYYDVFDKSSCAKKIAGQNFARGGDARLYHSETHSRGVNIKGLETCRSGSGVRVLSNVTYQEYMWWNARSGGVIDSRRDASSILRARELSIKQQQ